MNILFYDGVVIIKGNEIVLVVSYLLFLDSLFLFKEFGMCYWVVFGISEVIDSIMIVVFEEIGGIFLIKGGEFFCDVLEEELYKIFFKELVIVIVKKFFIFFKWKGGKSEWWIEF